MDFLKEATEYFITVAALSNDPQERELAEQAARTLKAKSIEYNEHQEGE